MAAGQLYVNVKLRQANKPIVWLCTRVVVFLAKCKIIDVDTAMLAAAKVMAKNFRVKVDKGKWRRLYSREQIESMRVTADA
jgi:hypothetical protein